jgi:hypothetical protein
LSEGGKEQFKTFVRGLFERAKSPYYFESEVASEMNNHFAEDFGLDKSEIESILISYFRRYCDTNKKLDANVWELYRNCSKTRREEVGNNHYRSHPEILQEANEIFRELVDVDLDSFLLAMILPEKSRSLFEVNSFVTTLYGSWYIFESLLNSKKESEWTYLAEFKQFFLKFREVGFSKRVEFNFNVIPIHLRN